MITIDRLKFLKINKQLYVSKISTCASLLLPIHNNHLSWIAKSRQTSFIHKNLCLFLLLHLFIYIGTQHREMRKIYLFLHTRQNPFIHIYIDAICLDSEDVRYVAIYLFIIAG